MDDLTRKIQEQIKLKYQLTQKNKNILPPLLRIGEYHQETGRYKVIYPNGGQVIAGIKIFNSSVPDGTPVRGIQAYGMQSISLDYKNHQPFEIQEEEKKRPSNLLDTYIIGIVDTSGSMDNEIPTIISSLNVLRESLRDEIYGTQERVDKYYKILQYSNERWLQWMSSDFRGGGEPNKIIIMAFINESAAGFVVDDPFTYHKVPRNIAAEPTDTFTLDRDNFLSTYSQREFFKGKIYSVQYPQAPNEEIAFSAHVRDAIDGNSPYPSGLQEYNLSYTLGLPASTPASIYLQDIKELLGL